MVFRGTLLVVVVCVSALFLFWGSVELPRTRPSLLRTFMVRRRHVTSQANILQQPPPKWEIVAKGNQTWRGKPEDRPVVLVVAATMDSDFKSETVGMLVSLVSRSDTPIDFVFLTTKPEVPIIKRWVKAFKPTFTIRAHFATFTVYGVKHMLAVNNFKLRYGTGEAGYVKAFLPEVLPPWLDRVLLIDTDALVFSPISLLWKRFSRFKNDTLLAATSAYPTDLLYPPDQCERDVLHCPHIRADPEVLQPDWPNASRNPEIAARQFPNAFIRHTWFCSCLMLLRLDRMRAAGWYSNNTAFMSTVQKAWARTRHGVGDQDIYIAVLEVIVEGKNPRFSRFNFQWIPNAWMASNRFKYRGLVTIGNNKHLGIVHFNGKNSNHRLFEPEEEKRRTFPFYEEWLEFVHVADTWDRDLLGKLMRPWES